MSSLILITLSILALMVVYLFLRSMLRKEPKTPPPPAQRIIRRVPERRETPEAAPGPESNQAGPVVEEQAVQSGLVAAGEDTLPSSLDWRPIGRAQLEVETVWRLEHALRELQDLGQTPTIHVDFNMEPRELSLVLASNPFYAAKILKTVNSAAFGLRYHIDSLQRAITFLGYNQVKNIVFQHVMSSKMFEVHKKSDYFDLLRFWKHSHAVSVCADFLLREVLRRTQGVGMITTAALMHDIGWVVYSRYDAEKADRLFRRLAGEPDVNNPMLFEEEVFGFNHLVAGRMLAEQWQIPKQICALIGFHHCGTFGLEGGVEQETVFGACVIAKAEELSAEMGYASPLPEPREIRTDLASILGSQVATLPSGSVKLREELTKTMKIIEEFDKPES
ncbi:MAG: hypothetical protein A3F83_15355 [Candidatus Glassbacteria bacterium RIFCSPLOWO2_12_FULL_58_11]|uniref:HDOD domain-containing protein n=1 Tax=Candidatus Glassbacteria bacterium RIFCSPLOWO2_12_FULL_58_11 TaxID=1817867 RepID=A0A1F5Z0W9_9BACT|nr:MAG: hypothetical protein A3F83_15355 [Candidatus Glassbacteria bacterium RIFCSPLOWO2_12_FULL_58_11]